MAITKTTINGKASGTLTPPNIRTPYIVNGVATADIINFSTSVADNDIFGKAGNDIITGGAGSDFISGGLGADSLIGGAGSDTLLGYAPVNSKVAAEVTASLTDGIDTLNGGLGDDNLDGGASNDLLTGGAGIDWFSISAGIDSISDLGNGADILLVGPGATVNATLFAAWTANSQSEIGGTANLSSNGFAVNVATTTGDKGFNITNTGTGTTFTGSAYADNLSGGAGNDSLSGGAGNDKLSGNTGNDLLNGGLGNDSLSGGLGNDILKGGAGNDNLAGGTGTDTFVYSVAANALTNKDIITDFVSGTDKLQFSVAALTKLGVVGAFSGTDVRFHSSNTGVAHDANDRLIYNKTSGVLSYDADGTGATAPIAIETLGVATHPALLATDISIIA